MSIDNNTRIRRVVEKPEIASQNRRAKLRADVAFTRLARDISRCRTVDCNHGRGVHTETGCQMNGCGCDRYQS